MTGCLPSTQLAISSVSIEWPLLLATEACAQEPLKTAPSPSLSPKKKCCPTP